MDFSFAISIAISFPGFFPSVLENFPDDFLDTFGGLWIAAILRGPSLQLLYPGPATHKNKNGLFGAHSVVTFGMLSVNLRRFCDVFWLMSSVLSKFIVRIYCEEGHVLDHCFPLYHEFACQWQKDGSQAPIRLKLQYYGPASPFSLKPQYQFSKKSGFNDIQTGAFFKIDNFWFRTASNFRSNLTWRYIQDWVADFFFRGSGNLGET